MTQAVAIITINGIHWYLRVCTFFILFMKKYSLTYGVWRTPNQTIKNEWGLANLQKINKNYKNEKMDKR